MTTQRDPKRRRGIHGPVVLLASLLVAGATAWGDDPEVPVIEGPASLQDAGRAARAALLPLKQGLMGALKGALQESPASAIEACKLAAPGITEGAAREGMEVGRTSHKTRNPANDPEPWMRPLLDHYRETPRSPQPARVLDLGARGVGYVEPIYTQELCLTCHGGAVDADLQALIRARYPEDRAVGFAEGELRGLFWVVLSPAPPPSR